MRTNLIVLIIGLFLGFFISEKFKDPVIKTEIKEAVKTKIVKITEPSGKIIETKTIEKKRDELPRQDLKRYSVSIGGLKELSFIQADARLGNMPLFIGAQAQKDRFNLLLRYEF